MTSAILRGLSTISAYFKFDILWRICQRLRPEDRRMLTWRLLHSDSERITVRRNGTLWTGNTNDEIVVGSVYCSGHFQGPQIDALLNWMNQRKRLTASRNVILDIGAHIGTTCIPLAQKTDAHILAIEPVPENFQLLHRNVTQNGLGHRITCVQKAVYSHRAFLEMAIPEGNHGGAFILPEKEKDTDGQSFNFGIRETMQVSAEPLISILREYDIQPEQVAFVWCDAEGCEAAVIESGTALWAAGVPCYLEINPEMLHVQNRLQGLPALLEKEFDRYLEIAASMNHTSSESFHSISKLAGFLDHLESGITDLLLLPKGFS